MKLDTITVGTKQITVPYYRAGQGEPLLYLHHFMGVVGWEPALARLAEHFDVIAPFAPGWGAAKDELTKMNVGPLDLTLHNQDVLAALGVDSAHVVGVGIGAWLAAELAAIAPACVRRLVLVNPVGIYLEDAMGADPFAQSPAAPTEVLFSDPALRQKYLLDGRELVDALVEELLDLRAAAKFLWPIMETQVRTRLPRIKAPTLVATSERDAIVPAAHGPEWARHIDGARQAEIKGAGHLAELERPDEFARLVHDFIVADSVAAVA
ncbi:MAG: alpha/beta fold hydrolase [Gammaproteobacteria bacterium]|nr:alpha/beta fold hydrolase [Gammaproteobacteria bacterium]MCP5199702.1 alpha/beta fold hydrolase [Gammaproteobacteria bacterium]